MKAIIGATALAGTVGIGGGYYVNLPKFGAKPQGRRLERVLASPHWNGTEFENFEPILNLMRKDKKGEGFLKAMLDIISPTKGKGIPASMNM